MKHFVVNYKTEKFIEWHDTFCRFMWIQFCRFDPLKNWTDHAPNLTNFIGYGTLLNQIKHREYKCDYLYSCAILVQKDQELTTRKTIIEHSMRGPYGKFKPSLRTFWNQMPLRNSNWTMCNWLNLCNLQIANLLVINQTYRYWYWI